MNKITFEYQILPAKQVWWLLQMNKITFDFEYKILLAKQVWWLLQNEQNHF